MMDVSDCESDAGASPSVPSDESASAASSPSVLKTTSASKRASSSTSVLMTPPSSGRRVPRRKIKVTPTAADINCVGLLKDENTPVTTRKKKRLETTTPDDPQVVDGRISGEMKRTKRRKTRSQRNLLTGKTGAVAAEGQVPKGEEAVALDEIDKVLEEKASKNNLSATNVKSIIRHVITNNMVQKMMMSATKKKVDADLGGSSDEDLVGPKMTRAKTKELMENQQVQLWPNLYSPAKMPQLPVSETQMLVQNDLPDDSSGDEYVPKEADFSELFLSEDESSGVGSQNSDIGSSSPSVSISRRLRRSITRRNLHTPTPEVQNVVEAAEHVFKTPPPRPKETREDSAICKRTRSKFPLKDTPLEALERELVPPDVTTDMYDDGCGVETDNEDWTDFLKKFWNEAPSINDLNEVDDECDPEYNVMEDEDVHDQEELRRDRAVKVPKKELNDLISELFEPGFLSEDDIEDISSLTGFTLLANNTDGGGGADASFQETWKEAADILDDKISVQNEDQVTAVTDDADVEAQAPAKENMDVHPNPSSQQGTVSDDQRETEEEAPLFRDQDLQFLQYQMRQHVQLLAQSYVLTASSEDAELQAISKSAKGMVTEIKNFADVNTTCSGHSSFAVSNLDSAWNVVNSWPQKSLQQSPIKKRILEEKYINESRFTVDDKTLSYKRFPRHIVKVIAEHNAFLYNHLLPKSLFHFTHTSRVTFSVHEDTLLVNALEDLKSTKMGVAQMAEIISRLLLVVHYPNSVYHRIKNLRRNKVMNCDEIIKRYFAEGILPEVDRAIIEADPQPLVGRRQKGLSLLWLDHLKSLEELPSHKWEGKPVAGQIYTKPKKKANSGKASASKKFTINRVFPNGTYLFDNKDSSVEAIPILDANGQPGAIIYVPKMLLNQNEAVAVQAPANLAKTWINQEPMVGAEAEILIKYDNLDLVPSWKENSPVLNAVTNLVNFQPAPVPVSAFVSTIQPQLFYPPGFGYHVVQPVGKPFSLNELGCSLPLPPSGAQVIDLASLQTPMKTKILEKVNEPMSEVKSDAINESDLMEDANGENTPEYDADMDTSTAPEVSAVSGETEDNIDDLNRDKSDGKSNAGGSSGNAGNKTSTSKTDGGSSEKKETSEYSSESGNMKSSCSKRTSSKPGKGDDSEDENEKKGNRKRSIPDDCTKDRANDDDNEDGNNNSGPESEKPRKKTVASGVPLPTVSPGTFQNKSTAQQSLSSPTYTRGPQLKKAKRSPGNTQANRSRTSKYNVASAEKLLQDDPETFDDVADAYMEAYLAKVQATTEPNHPGLYATFIQILLEAGDGPSNQTELYSKVKVLFKEYPDLLKDFESYLDTSLEEVNDALNLAGSSSTDETMRLIEFIQKIDKFTEDCPQLNAKVLNKLKSLKDKPNSTEKDVANALEPFFVGSRVMMESFKSLLPGVYKPQSASSGLDWEEIELDMEDPPKDNDELNFEVVKVPEEKTVPATSTCPCTCHTSDPDPAYSSRSKHCPKCSIKDGKVYIHNGRVMRPVSVELSPVKKSVAVSVITATASVAPRPIEQRQHKSKPAEFKEPEKKSQTTVPSAAQLIPPPTVPKSSFNLTPTENSDIKQQSRTQQNTKAEETPSSSQAGTSESIKIASSGQSQSEKSDVEMEWSEEEDEKILRSLQEEPDLEVAFQKMAELMPNRCLEEIKRHCNELIEIIREAKAESQSENLK